MNRDRDPKARSSPPPEANDAADLRTEKLMAYHLGALRDDEAETVRRSISEDPEWERASDEALGMIEVLRREGGPVGDAPKGLAERTLKRLHDESPAKKKIKDISHLPFAFTARVAAAVFLVVSLPALWFGGRYVFSKPQRMSMLWRAESELAAGAPYAPHLMVRNTSSKEPVRGAAIEAHLEPMRRKDGAIPVLIGKGTSDAKGVVTGEQWCVPDVAPGEYRLVVEARSGWGTLLDRVEREVTVVKAARLVLSPDRAQARPGETIRARTLLVSEANSKPIPGEPVAIDVVDPEGNRIARSENRTSEFGLAWAEFPLDTLAREGAYVVRARSAGLSAQRAVQVKQYRLPAYRVTIALDRTWFGAQDEITGLVSAITFDGHPVGGARGEVRLITEDGPASKRSEMRLDGNGGARFALAPLGLGSVKESDVASVRLEVALEDPAGRRASKDAVVAVSRTPVVVSAVAEAGELVTGVENLVYLVARRPDGSPASGKLTVEREMAGNGKQSVETDTLGVAVLRLSEPEEPSEVLLVSGSVEGDKFEPRRVSLPVRPFQQRGAPPYGGLLIRTERSVASAGDRLGVTVFSAEPNGTAFIALRQGIRPIAVVGVEIEGGRGEAFIDIPGGLSGMLTLEATLALRDGRLWTDSRLVAVAGDANVQLTATTDRPSYRPGDTARLSFRVVDAKGAGLPAAVSVVAVDEALLELTGKHPGLAQALHAAGVNVLRAPGFPLDPTAFGPTEGETQAARAALAAVRPCTVAGVRARLQELVDTQRIDAASAEQIGSWISGPARVGDQMPLERVLAGLKDTDVRDEVQAMIALRPAQEALLDTAPSKIAAHGAWRQETWRLLGRFLVALPVAALVLLVLLVSWGSSGTEPIDAHRKAAGAVPAITGIVAAAAFGGMAYFEMTDLLPFLVILNCVLVGSHGLLLARTETLRQRADKRLFNTSPLLLAVVACDAGMILFTLGAIAQVGDREGMALGILLLIGAFLAIALQRDLSMPSKEREYSLFARGVAGLVVVALLGSYFLLPFFALRGQMMLMESLSSGGYSPGVPAASSRTEWGERAPGFPGAVGRPMPRLRWDFPETLVFAPQIVTDAEGRAILEVPVADSLTTWRVQADAVASRGGVAGTHAEVVVTQPFSADILLPTSVTAGDVLYAPVVVSNHTAQPHRVELALRVTGALAVKGTRQTIRVPPKSVASAEFGLRFDKSGTATIQVTALADNQEDAVQRQLAVLPDGRPVGFCMSSFVDDTGDLTVNVPEDAIPGTIRTELRIHRGPLSQVIDGLESMLREPYGCFEQTSSATYPNVLVLSYLRATGTAKPEIEKRATALIAKGYQRLLRFEVGSRSGGFSLFGRAPASAWLTAYGLMEFTDMAEVYPVDSALLDRVRAWVVAQVRADGSFPAMDRCHDRIDVGLDIAGTAYTVWALGQHAPQASVDFLRARLPDVEKDAYLCALVANALAERDRAAAGHLAEKLRGLAAIRAVDGEHHAAELVASRTLAWGYGDTATVEATALGVLALLETGQDMELAKMLVAALQERVRPGGGWGSTHATVLALKALVRTASMGKRAGPTRIVAEVNGRPLAPIDIPAEDVAVPASVPLDLAPGRTVVTLRVSGGPVAARVSGQVYVPWDTELESHGSALNATVRYSELSVQKGTSVLGSLTVTAQAREAELPMVEWGMPAGFVPEAEDLNSLKTKGLLANWELSGRTLRLYLPDMAPRKPVTLSVRFYATAKGKLKGPAGKCYEYYRRHEAEVLEPATFEVF